MKKKIAYQIPAVHFISLCGKTAMGYCSDGTGAAQVTVPKLCLAGFAAQSSAALCEGGSGNVTTYSECNAGPSHVAQATCDNGNEAV